MNPFVNLKKRSISLPSGCKDLADVLRVSPRSCDEHADDGTVRRFIHLLLFQAQQDHATELVIGATSVGGDTSISYKVEGISYDMAPLPSHIRPALIAELARLAKLSEGQFPSEGVLDVTFGDLRLRWGISMTSADAECLLRHVHD